MPLKIIRQDITKVRCDAIVNAANCTLLGGGGVDGAIHKAAGAALLKECRSLNGCKTGEAKITGGYNLPCKYIIHTVGPVYRGGGCGEAEKLSNCYKNSLALACKYNCECVAFPLISTGAYGFPMAEAFAIAGTAITDFLAEHEMLVYLVTFSEKSLVISKRLFSDIEQFIDGNYVAEYDEKSKRSIVTSEDARMPKKAMYHAPCTACFEEKLGDEYFEKVIDESFSQMLLRKIDESGMSDTQCYKKANIDKRLFSKIRSNSAYKPSKSTVLSFCIALEMPMEDTQEMLMKAGFALSHSNKFDVIIEYFISHGDYDIFRINEALYTFDQNLLGSVN